MSTEIIRGHQASRFTTLGNEAVRDSRLSLRARGLLLLMISYPPGWRMNTESLAKENPEGRDAIRTAMAELRKYRYVILRTARGERGRFSRRMEVYDCPQDPEGLDDPPGTEGGRRPCPDGATSTAGPAPQPDPEPAPEPAGRRRETRSRSEQGRFVSSQVTPTPGFPSVGKPGVIPKTVTKDGSKDGGPSDKVSRPASRRGRTSGPTATPAKHTPTREEVVTGIREGIARFFGAEEDWNTGDGDVLDLWYAYGPPDGLVFTVYGYFERIFRNFRNAGRELDDMLANIVRPGEDGEHEPARGAAA